MLDRKRLRLHISVIVLWLWTANEGSIQKAWLRRLRVHYIAYQSMHACFSSSRGERGLLLNITPRVHSLSVGDKSKWTNTWHTVRTTGGLLQQCTAQVSWEDFLSKKYSAAGSEEQQIQRTEFLFLTCGALKLPLWVLNVAGKPLSSNVMNSMAETKHLLCLLVCQVATKLVKYLEFRS